MKIVVVGATGTIGKAVVAALAGRHEVVKVGKRGGDRQVDITDSESIRRLFEQIGRFDALVSAAGKVHFGELSVGFSDSGQEGGLILNERCLTVSQRRHRFFQPPISLCFRSSHLWPPGIRRSYSTLGLLPSARAPARSRLAEFPTPVPRRGRC